MNKLGIKLENCYGIKSLDYEFDFDPGADGAPRAYAIYAPNGTMKTSFTRTFDDLSNKKVPVEERFNRKSTHDVKADGAAIDPEAIYVLKSEIDISADSPSITSILVDPKHKTRYDELLIDLDKLKSKLTKDLSKVSGIKQADVEKTILQDWSEDDFSSCVGRIQSQPAGEDLSLYIYNTIFDPKALAVLESKEFSSKAKEFNQRYQELFEQGSMYQKGVFNPSKAETSFKTLKKEGFFEGGHRVHLKGEDKSITKEELDEKLKIINAKIDGDADLKRIKEGLAKNAQTDALAELIERLSTSQFEYLLEKLKAENSVQFKKELWIYYIHSNQSAKTYLDTFDKSKDEIQIIENEASQSAPRWENAVELFNSRFVDMPFSLSIVDQAQAVLGRKDRVQLRFTFTDGGNKSECLRGEIKNTLSQGERRALYLLNFIFDVEERVMNQRETVFILDDIADSFDYKNKHAILQYLRDLTKIGFFHQIVLTHNFDFFRALSQGNGGFVHRKRCLMTSKGSNGISLSVAEGVSNYFVKVWKPKIANCNRVLYSTIPFTRNLIEYTTPSYSKDQSYRSLTSLLHWRQDTDQITVDQYLNIYNQLFKTTHSVASTDKAIDMLFTEANSICTQAAHTGLNLEDKVLLSIATRIRAEKFLTEKLRKIKGNPNFWYQGKSDQFRGLLDEYVSLPHDVSDIRILEKVGITVNSNIHLNSFMYEPILDLTIEHLIHLYQEVSALNV